MATTSPPSDRLITLDLVRGLAVMGIFSVNVIGMAMIQGAYFYPPSFGFDGLADKLTWFTNFVFVDGKLRALFSILFGASMLLVIERAAAAGRSPARTHYARMVVLMLFGFMHFALLWWGDILTHYAAVGMIAFVLWKLKARILLIISIIGFVLHAAPGVYFFSQEAAGYYQSKQPDAPAELRKKWEERSKSLKPDAKKIAEDRAEHHSIATRFNAVFPDKLMGALDLGPLVIETLALMLLGMAGYKSGFLTGQWDDRRYRKVALIGFGVGAAVYAALGAFAWSANFAPIQFFGVTQIAAPPLRPVMAMGYAALFILMFRNPSALRERLAAIGRTAFTNYVGCTIIGSLIFFGSAGDLYARLSRFEAWLLVPPMWALMLLWSKPWLDRFNYGPFEWAWRSLSRLELQPMRKRVAAPTAAAAGA